MMKAPDWFQHDVSRETLDKLEAFSALLLKWTAKINLIAKSTTQDIANRHIWDSAQVYRASMGHWADIGSGGGLPGVVVAILRHGAGCASPMTLIESDHRKATFLRTCGRELELPLNVVAERIENTNAQHCDVVSARALANLDGLLALASPHLNEDGQCLFMKGARWQDEVSAAEQNWRFSYEATQSMTNAEAVILTIRDIERV